MVSETTSEDTTSTTPYVYTGFSKLEAAFGLFWLSLGAIVSLVLEVIYLTAWLSLPGGCVPPLHPHRVFVQSGAVQDSAVVDKE